MGGDASPAYLVPYHLADLRKVYQRVPSKLLADCVRVVGQPYHSDYFPPISEILSCRRDRRTVYAAAQSGYEVVNLIRFKVNAGLRFCDIPAIIFERMARKLRVEIEGGLYHLIARGNDRQNIFHSPDDRYRFLALLAKEKARSGFFFMTIA